MIEGIIPLLPSSVAVAEVVGGARDTADELFPSERILVASALTERQEQFAAARSCARRAMARLGTARQAVPADAAGAPVWPDGLVGSITHCPGYTAAALARGSDVPALGIDAEPRLPLREGVLPLVASEHEQDHLRDLARHMPEFPLDRVLFSAKEAAYKAWFPLNGVRLGFRDAEIELTGKVCSKRNGASGTFLVRIVPREAKMSGCTPYEEFSGRWCVGESFILTAVARA